MKTANAPYSTRILVRRPADRARFSGHAVVELLNPARRFDWAMMSGYSRDSFIEHGDAWVGVTMPGSVDALRKFNAARYPAVAFANPDPAETCAAGRGGATTSEQEDGPKRDMLSQVAAALKNGANLNARYVYMTSQGADVLTSCRRDPDTLARRLRRDSSGQDSGCGGKDSALRAGGAEGRCAADDS